MRIAYLSIGRHVHTERWIRFFAKRGHECHLLTVQPGSIDGVTVHDIRSHLPAKALRYWWSLRRVKRLLAEIHPDLLHTHFLTGYGYWGHFSGFQPKLLTVWGDDVYVTPNETPLKGWLARKALASATVVTGDSVDILRDCVKLGADAGKCYEVQWGVDFKVFHPQRATNVRSRLGIGDDETLIFSPRSYTQAYYNIDVIIAAAARLQQERDGVHFLFAGYEGDPAPFLEKARAAGLTERTHFVGRIPHEEFAETLAACDLFVSVPSVDATAVSLLEAMACGKAIIVSSLASSLEWIENERNGLVVPPRDEDALLDAMRRLASDGTLRQRFGEESVHIVRARADHEKNMEKVEQLYRFLATGAPLAEDVLSLAQRGLA